MIGNVRLYADGVSLTAADGQGLVCPGCGGGDFDLQLGGRNGGRITCSHCLAVLQEANTANDPQQPVGR